MNDIKTAFSIIRYIYDFEISIGDFSFTMNQAIVFFLLASVLLFFIFRMLR